LKTKKSGLKHIFLWAAIFTFIGSVFVIIGGIMATEINTLSVFASLVPAVSVLVAAVVAYRNGNKHKS
jgi:ABC-type Na+ efflux pump permease subunit